MFCPVLLEESVELLALDTCGVGDGERASLGDHLLSSVGTLGLSPSWFLRTTN